MAVCQSDLPITRIGLFLQHPTTARASFDSDGSSILPAQSLPVTKLTPVDLAGCRGDTRQSHDPSPSTTQERIGTYRRLFASARCLFVERGRDLAHRGHRNRLVSILSQSSRATRVRVLPAPRLVSVPASCISIYLASTATQRLQTSNQGLGTLRSLRGPSTGYSLYESTSVAPVYGAHSPANHAPT
jgi:hypothetical protein